MIADVLDRIGELNVLTLIYRKDRLGVAAVGGGSGSYGIKIAVRRHKFRSLLGITAVGMVNKIVALRADQRAVTKEEPHQRGHRVTASNVCSKTVSYYVQSDPDMDHGCLYWKQPFLKSELNLTEH